MRQKVIVRVPGKNLDNFRNGLDECDEVWENAVEAGGSSVASWGLNSNEFGLH